MRDLRRLKNTVYQARNVDASEVNITITCPCKYETRVASLTAFTDPDQDFIVSDTPLLVRCPRCNAVYVGNATFDKADETVSISLDPGADHREIPDVPVGDCTECDGTIMASDYDEGPDHPAAGWKYYECSNCGTGISATRFDEA